VQRTPAHQSAQEIRTYACAYDRTRSTLPQEELVSHAHQNVLAAIVAVLLLRPAVTEAQDDVINGLSHRVEALEVVMTGVLRRLADEYILGGERRLE
jgi:hypothetical protein